MIPGEAAIRQRLQLLEGYVRQLQPYRARSIDEVQSDVGLAWAIEHGLQLSIQSVLDVCHQLVAALALGAPATSQEAIRLLREAGVFPAAFSETLARMARFRNVLVHVYAEVDVARVHEHLQNHLDDFAGFATHVVEFLARAKRAAGGEAKG